MLIPSGDCNKRWVVFGSTSVVECNLLVRNTDNDKHIVHAVGSQVVHQILEAEVQKSLVALKNAASSHAQMRCHPEGHQVVVKGLDMKLLVDPPS